MFSACCHPPGASREVITSSKISSAPAAVARAPQRKEKVPVGGYAAARAEHRFDQDRRKLVSVRLDQAHGLLDVVIGRQDEFVGHVHRPKAPS